MKIFENEFNWNENKVKRLSLYESKKKTQPPRKEEEEVDNERKRSRQGKENNNVNFQLNKYA